MPRLVSKATLCTILILVASTALARPHGPPPSRENTARKCADRKDNDGDHLVDCADPDYVGHCPEKTATAWGGSGATTTRS